MFEQTDGRERQEIETAQNPEVFKDPETTAAWFAGVLEVGATVTIGVSRETQKNGKVIVRTSPVLDISCSNDVSHKLYEQYGGQERGKAWRKSGRVAAEIVSSIAPFAVGRKKHVEAMQQWLKAGYVADQIEIARSIQDFLWQSSATPSEYDELLENPAFLAGVIDNRGMVYRRTDNSLGLNIYSRNKALLASMEKKYKGKTEIYKEEGSEVTVLDKEFITKSDNEYWMLTCGRVAALLTQVAPYVQEPLLPGWDESRLAVAEEKRDAFASLVGEYVRGELRLIKEEKIPRLSTDEVLAERFGVGIKKIANSLRRVLSPQEYQERRELTKKLSKAGVDVVTNLAIRRYITQEVQDVREGRKDEVTPLEEVAQIFGTTDTVLQKQVIPHLDPDTHAARLAYVRRDIMRLRNAASGKWLGKPGT